MPRRASRSFSEANKQDLLKVIGECRNACVKAITVAPIGDPVYQSTNQVMDAIDNLAGVLTGDRGYFHIKPAPTWPMGHRKEE